MFSLQLHIPLNSPLGQRIPLIQHLVATAVVLAFKKPFGYKVSDDDLILSKIFEKGMNWKDLEQGLRAAQGTEFKLWGTQNWFSWARGFLKTKLNNFAGGRANPLGANLNFWALGLALGARFCFARAPASRKGAVSPDLELILDVLGSGNIPPGTFFVGH